MSTLRTRQTMTVGVDGRTGNFGFWKPELTVSRAPLVQAVGREYDSVLAVGLRLHNLNRDIIEKKPVIIPDAQARAQRARADQVVLRKAQEKLAEIELANVQARMLLQPYSYRLNDAPKNPTTRDTQQYRSELRAVLRAMPDDKTRLAALSDSQDFRRAALEMPAAASGLGKGDYDFLYRSELEARFSDELAQLADTDEAIDAMKMSVATVNKALENELRAIAAPVAEPVAREPATDFA